MDHSQKIAICFYNGRYNPILLFRVQSQLGFSQLRTLFASFANAIDGHKEDLCRYEWINCLPSIGSLVLERLPSRKAELSRTLRLLEPGKNRAVVHWSRHGEGWLECAEKLDRLTVPGRQDLDIGHYNDASVEISFMEYGK